MLWPLNETLTSIEPYLPRRLISPQVFGAAKTIAKPLQDSMSSYYLECRLGADASQLDFLTCATAEDGRTILADKRVLMNLGDLLCEIPGWRCLRRFLEQWADPASSLYTDIPLIWFEFDDIGGCLDEAPLPSLSVCLDKEFLDAHPRAQHINPLDRQTYQRTTAAVLEFLGNGPLAERSKHTLLACFDCLPVGGQLVHLSLMLARQPMVLKLYGSLPRSDLQDYLTHIGWAGSATELANILINFDYFIGNNIFVDLTIDGGIASRLGIAFPHDQLTVLPQPDRQRALLLDRCVELGLCTAEKRSAFLSWSGQSRELFHGQAWPIRVHRWIDVKIIYQPPSTLEAKGYLGFMPRFSLL